MRTRKRKNGMIPPMSKKMLNLWVKRAAMRRSKLLLPKEKGVRERRVLEGKKGASVGSPSKRRKKESRPSSSDVDMGARRYQYIGKDSENVLSFMTSISSSSWLYLMFMIWRGQGDTVWDSRSRNRTQSASVSRSQFWHIRLRWEISSQSYCH